MPAPNPINPFGDAEVMLDETAEQIEVEGKPDPAAAPVQETVTAADSAAKPESQQAEPPNKTGVVPYQRFQEVNEKLRTVEKQAQEDREWRLKVEERSKVLTEARQQAEQVAAQQRQAAERPDPEIDPVGAKQWDHDQQIMQLVQANQQLQNQLQQFSQNFQQNTVEQQRNQYVTYDVTRFQQQHPDYINAANYVAQKRMEMWQRLGYSPENARVIVENETNAIIESARQTGKSIAEFIYGLAQEWGYKPANGNGATQTAVSPQSARLQQVAAGQKLQGVGRIPAATGQEATSTVRNMTQAQLAAMSEAEWSRIKANPQLKAELAYALAAAEGVDVSDAMSVLKDQ